jgi:multiple antibiotic resistance protein
MLQLTIQAIPFVYAALFPVLNPFGSAVIFLALTRGVSHQVQNKLALKVALNTFVLLVIVLLSGSWILRLLGITIPVVQIGGGLVVAYIGWNILNQSTDPTNDTTALTSDKDAHNMAFFPLTMPLTAGPGCIAVTLTVGAHEVVRSSMTETYLGQLGAVIGILLASLTVFLCYRYANRLSRLLGTAGKQVIIRLAAFINLCIGIQIIAHGVHSLLH